MLPRMLPRQREDPQRHRLLLVMRHRLEQDLVTRATTSLPVEALRALVVVQVARVVDPHLVVEAHLVVDR